MRDVLGAHDSRSAPVSRFSAAAHDGGCAARNGLDVQDATAMKSPLRIALSAGYTAGHINAAIAVGEAYRKHYPHGDVIFVGERNGLESQIVGRAGWPFHGVSAAPLMRTGVISKFIGGIALLRGFFEARKFLNHSDISLVVGFGGYPTVGVLLAAWSLNIPVVIHEANIVAGRANRLLAKIAKRVLVAADETRADFADRDVAVVGQPVRERLVELSQHRHVPPDPERRPVRLLVLGGSLGSEEVNLNAPLLVDAIQKRQLPVSVLHQTGHRNQEQVRALYRQTGIECEVTAFIDDVYSAYLDADFVITAAGAITLAELTFAGVPALIVPLRSAADDHQTRNALATARRAKTMVVAAQDWDVPRLAEEISELLIEPSAWTVAAESWRKLADSSAADAVLRECEQIRLAGALSSNA